MRSILNIYLTALVFSGIIMSGCGSYQQDIMFKPNKDMEAEQLSQVVSEAEKNYIIQVNDLLNLNVFTNKGERIIDPNFELGVGQGGNQQMQRQQRDFDYLVQIDGTVKLPILDRVKLEGLTIQQAETLLEQRYNEYYKDSYVKLIYNNKRVIVLGANGGEVVPLPNENMSLIEVIALAGGIDQTGKAHNIRLVRGDLSNPSVYMVDLGTIGGMKASILNVEPGDIIYIEPRRRVFFEALSDVTPNFEFGHKPCNFGFCISKPMMEANSDPYSHVSNGQVQDDLLNNFDLDKVIVVLKKSIIWFVIIFSITCSLAYLYVRYTKPLYESQSVIKLDLQNEASIIGISNPLENPNIAGLSGEIELLKSELFFDRVVRAINYDVSYFFYGKILTEERYRNSPFVVSYKIKNDVFYDKAFDIEVKDPNSFTISYEINGNENAQTYSFGEDIQTEHFNLLIEKTNAFNNSNGVGSYYFTINSDAALNSYFSENIIVEPLNFNAKTIRISLRDHNRFKARDFVTAIDTIYLAYTKEHKNKAIEQKLDFLNTQLEETNKRLEDYEDYFESFTIEHRTTSLENDLGKTILQLEALDTQYVKLKTTLSNLELIKLQIDGKQPMIIGSLTSGALPPSLGRTLDEYNKLRGERETKLASYNENTFVIQQIDKKLRGAEKEVKKLFEDYQSLIQEQIKTVDARRKSLENSFVQLPAMGTEFRKNRRFYNLQDETYLQLVKSKAELEIARAGTVTNFVILSPASNPQVPVEPQRLLIYGLGLVAGLVISVFFVLIRYLLHNKINSSKEIERLVKAPILGSVPKYNGNDTFVTRLVIDQNPKSGISEALRAIRTNMEFLLPKKDKRVISITSTISGEGKTFISVNLGAILSLSNKKVVIVDLDMRKPKVHMTFGDDKGDDGVSTILIGRNPVEKCVRQTEIEGLSYITAGPTPPNPSELLLGDSFDQLIKDLKSQFDVIILDTPPVGLVTDGVLAMQKADLSIYVFRADYSRRAFVNSLNNLVNTKQFDNLCVLINAVKFSKRHGYGYGYGAGYYDENVQQNGKPHRMSKIFGVKKQAN